MYAANIVENAKTEVAGETQHPYTVGLMNSIPKLTGDSILSGIPGRLLLSYTRRLQIFHPLSSCIDSCFVKPLL